MSLLATFERIFFCYGDDRQYWIGYSGGLDSHVLLSICHTLRTKYPIKLRAIHVNHNLQKQSKCWAAHCEQICGAYDIDFYLHPINLSAKPGKSLEEIAREKRYAIFKEYLYQGDVLLTAHQQDDQAETLLLQLIRGAGLKGLASMPMEKPFGKGIHMRPFLTFPRSVLQEYADLYGLQYINDVSNLDRSMTRNFIRHEILPLLKSRWPTVTNAISRAANHCAEAQTILESFAKDVQQKAAGTKPETLSVKKILAMPTEHQKLTLRTWIHAQHYKLPDTKKLQTIVDTVLVAAIDKMPSVHWGNVELRRFRDDLYLMHRLAKHNNELELEWNFANQLVIPGVGVLNSQFTSDHCKIMLSGKLDCVSVRFRRGGEMLFVQNRGHCPLKKLLLEWGVPPWERDRIPLIYKDGKIICVPDYFIDSAHAAEVGGQGYILEFKKG